MNNSTGSAESPTLPAPSPIFFAPIPPPAPLPSTARRPSARLASTAPSATPFPQERAAHLPSTIPAPAHRSFLLNRTTLSPLPSHLRIISLLAAAARSHFP